MKKVHLVDRYRGVDNNTATCLIQYETGRKEELSYEETIKLVNNMEIDIVNAKFTLYGKLVKREWKEEGRNGYAVFDIEASKYLTNSEGKSIRFEAGANIEELKSINKRAKILGAIGVIPIGENIYKIETGKEIIVTTTLDKIKLPIRADSLFRDIRCDKLSLDNLEMREVGYVRGLFRNCLI